MSSAIRRSPGPTPAIGLMAPPSTWYRPRNSRVRSIATTSFGSSTTQMTDVERRGSRQTWHCSCWATFPQTSQKRTRALTSLITWTRRATFSGSSARRWNAMRWALLGPTPGSRPSSSIRSWTAPSYTPSAYGVGAGGAGATRRAVVVASAAAGGAPSAGTATSATTTATGGREPARAALLRAARAPAPPAGRERLPRVHRGGRRAGPARGAHGALGHADAPHQGGPRPRGHARPRPRRVVPPGGRRPPRGRAARARRPHRLPDPQPPDHRRLPRADVAHGRRASVRAGVRAGRRVRLTGTPRDRGPNCDAGRARSGRLGAPAGGGLAWTRTRAPTRSSRPTPVPRPRPSSSGWPGPSPAPPGGGAGRWPSRWPSCWSPGWAWPSRRSCRRSPDRGRLLLLDLLVDDRAAEHLSHERRADEVGVGQVRVVRARVDLGLPRGGRGRLAGGAPLRARGGGAGRRLGSGPGPP